MKYNSHDTFNYSETNHKITSAAVIGHPRQQQQTREFGLLRTYHRGILNNEEHELEKVVTHWTIYSRQAGSRHDSNKDTHRMEGNIAFSDPLNLYFNPNQHSLSVIF